MVRIAIAADAPVGDAVAPWISYEAEAGSTNAVVLGPDWVGHTAAREASGRKCIQLTHEGDYVEFAAKSDAQAVIVRYCIPDSQDEKGKDATLSLYVNRSLKKKLPLTSRYTHLYGKYPFTNDPAAGTPRHFWDEVRTLIGTLHAGDLIRLQKDADDSAAEYLIDLIDLESVPPPLEMPANSLSVVDFGAQPDGMVDSYPAFAAAISAGRSQHKMVWIPQGRFQLQRTLNVSDVTLSGAGMWYSVLVGIKDYVPGKRVAICGNGSDISLADFAIIGNLNYRNDAEENDGVVGSFGTHSSIRNVWVEHTKTGAWLTNSDGLLVENCRFRDTIADGINLCVGMRHTIVRNCTARGSGDDGFAVWPATYTKANYPSGENHIINCTAQCPFLAQGFSIYGGLGNTVDHCQAIDIPYGAGLFASTTFPTEAGFGGITSFANNRILRAGDIDGAIGLVANRLDLTGLRFDDIQVIDSVRDGIKFTSIGDRQINDVAFDRVQIVNTGLAGEGCGVEVDSAAAGNASLKAVSVTNAKSNAIQNRSGGFRLSND